MFSGCFTTFDTTWVLNPVRSSMRKDVEVLLTDQARAAVKARVPLIWLYWPYSEAKEGEAIELVLKKFESKELKTNPLLKRTSRWGSGDAPTCVKNVTEANMVILHIRVPR